MENLFGSYFLVPLTKKRINERIKYHDTSTFFPSEIWEERVKAHLSLKIWNDFVDEWDEAVTKANAGLD